MNFKILFLALMIAAASACSKQAPTDTSPVDSTPSMPLTVTNWGPQGTTVGVPVNAFPDGQSGLYFTLSRNFIADGTEVMFDGTSLGGVAVKDNLITAMLPAAHLAAEGKKRIIIKLGSGELIEVGDFVITGPNTGQVPDQDSAAPAEPTEQAAKDAAQTPETGQDDSGNLG